MEVLGKPVEMCRRGEVILHWDLNIGRGNRGFV
jgi:hypothetical protein